MKQLQILILVAFFAIFVFVSDNLPQVGDVNSPASTHVSPRYIENSYKETGSTNFVTAVLADYRAFDTFGETVVIFTAGIGTIMILRLFLKD